jgi:opacity protein-like surface antigen
MKTLARVLVCSGILLLLPVTAFGQAQLTLFVGGNFGGDTGVSLDESITDTSQLDFGARLGLFTGGLFSLEFEYGHTPNFYGKGTVFDSSSVRTFMGSLALGFPAGPVRPYLVLGVGMIKRTVEYAPGQGPGSVTDSRAAYDIGGGLSIFFSQHVGINGDFRYFRNFTAGNVILDGANDKFNYARATIGVTFKF